MCYRAKQKTMKKIILSLALAGSLMIAATACNSTKNVSNSTDSTTVDTTGTTTPADTTATDTTKTTPPDTTKTPAM